MSRDPSRQIAVILAEDSLIVRQGLISLIEMTDGVELVAACSDLDTLLSAVDEHGPDAVLTDIRMPPDQSDEGIRAALALRSSHPDIGVVVLSQHVEPEYVVAFFAEGTERRAYLLKEHVYDPDQLLAALRAVVSGGSLIDPKVTEALLRDKVSVQQSPLHRLTERETEVLDAMAQGLENRAIADRLSLSVRGIERHINSIFSKLALTEVEDVHRRVKAVLLYLTERG